MEILDACFLQTFLKPFPAGMQDDTRGLADHDACVAALA
jgi:hypothetical protein